MQSHLLKTQTWGSPLTMPDAHSITHLDYSSSTHLLSAVFRSGAVLLCRLNLQYFPSSDPSSNILGSFSEAFSIVRWICNPNSGALISKISPQSQLLAIGLENSIVALHRLNQQSGIGDLDTASFDTNQMRAKFGGFGLDNSAGYININPMAISEPVRVLSLFDWGYSPKLTGRVLKIEWDPSGRVLAVGYESQGMVLWSASGCRLLCTLRQSRAQGQLLHSRSHDGAPSTPQFGDAPTTPKFTYGQGHNSNPLISQMSMQTESFLMSGNHNDSESEGIFGSLQLENGVRGMTWLNQGYNLGVVLNGQLEQIAVFDFLKQPKGHHHLLKSGQQRGFEEDLYALMGHDRIALIKQSTPQCGSVFPKVSTNPQQAHYRSPSMEDNLSVLSNDQLKSNKAQPKLQTGDQSTLKSEDLSIQHILVPAQYISSNWPILEISISNESQDIAVAGRRGFCLYNYKIGRENGWRSANGIGEQEGENGSDEQEKKSNNFIWLYPRHHLNQNSVLVKQQLAQVPNCIDCLGQYMLLSFQHSEIVVVKVIIKGVVNPKTSPQVSLQLIKSFNASTLTQPVKEITLVAPPYFLDANTSIQDNATSVAESVVLPNRSPYRAQSLSSFSVESTPHNLNQQLLRQKSHLSGGFAPKNLMSMYRSPDISPAKPPPPTRSWFEWAWGGPQEKDQGIQNQGVEVDSEEMQLLFERQQIMQEFETLAKNGIQGILEPGLCILGRWGGQLSILDIDSGQENLFARDIECFWLGRPLPGPIANVNNQTPRSTVHSLHYPNLDPKFQSIASTQPVQHSNDSPRLLVQQPKLNPADITTSQSSKEMKSPSKPTITSPTGPVSPTSLQQSPNSQGDRKMGIIEEASPQVGQSVGGGSPDLGGTDAYQEQHEVFTPYNADRIHSYIDQSFKQSYKMDDRKTNLDDSTESQQVVETPWWGYGPQGMYLWFPSFIFSSNQPLTKVRVVLTQEEASQKTDPELEFDREVYPLGISQMIASIVGITERMVRVRLQNSQLMRPLSLNNPSQGQDSHNSLSNYQYNSENVILQTPTYYPTPQLQSILACLLRRLIQKGAVQEAIALAKMHQYGSHFVGSLEWLLFSALENEKGELQKSQQQRSIKLNKVMLNNDFRSPSMTQLALSRNPSAISLLAPQHQGRVSSSLRACANIVRAFPFIFPDVVVSVSRKTDPQFWPPLFNSTVSPSEILKEIVSQKRIRLAACFLVVVDHMEGALSSQAWTLKVINEALKLHDYDLTADLIRFLAPPEIINMAIFSGLTDQQEFSETAYLAMDSSKTTPQASKIFETKPSFDVNRSKNISKEQPKFDQQRNQKSFSSQVSEQQNNINNGQVPNKVGQEQQQQQQQQQQIQNGNVQKQESFQDKRVSWLMQFFGYSMNENSNETNPGPFSVGNKEAGDKKVKGGGTSHIITPINDGEINVNDSVNSEKTQTAENGKVQKTQSGEMRNGKSNDNDKDDKSQQLRSLNQSYSQDYQMVGALKGVMIISSHCWHLVSQQKFEEILQLSDSLQFIDHGLVKVMAINNVAIRSMQNRENTGRNILKQAIQSLAADGMQVGGSGQLPGVFLKPRAEDYVRSYQSLIAEFRNQIMAAAKNRSGEGGQNIEDEVLQNARTLLKLFRRNSLPIFFVPLALMLQNISVLHDFVEKNLDKGLWNEIVLQLDKANLLQNVKEVVALASQGVDKSVPYSRNSSGQQSRLEGSVPPRSISFQQEQSQLQKQKSGTLFTQNSLTRYSSMGGYTENELEFDQIANQMILSSSSSMTSLAQHEVDDDD